jgi:hypothetical protein
VGYALHFCILLGGGASRSRKGVNWVKRELTISRPLKYQATPTQMHTIKVCISALSHFMLILPFILTNQNPCLFLGSQVKPKPELRFHITTLSANKQSYQSNPTPIHNLYPSPKSNKNVPMNYRTDPLPRGLRPRVHCCLRHRNRRAPSKRKHKRLPHHDQKFHDHPKWQLLSAV